MAPPAKIKRSRRDQIKYLTAQGSRRASLVTKKLAPYAPSVGNTITVVGGGAIAGLVNSGVTPIPAEIAGLSTPLIIGGVLAGYGIYASSSKNMNPMIAKTAVNLGQGMIAVWASEFVQEQVEKQQTPVLQKVG